MLGLPPVQLDTGLFKEAAWSTERKNSAIWDIDYPGVLDSA